MAARGRIKFTAWDLAKVGVEVADKYTLLLRCMTCGCTWTPDMKPSGRMPHGWWRCPSDPQHTKAPANGQAATVRSE